jgi:hypothetical protein
MVTSVNRMLSPLAISYHSSKCEHEESEFARDRHIAKGLLHSSRREGRSAVRTSKHGHQEM